MDNTQRIGCSLGEGSGSRVTIVDPNEFYGEKDSSRNIPVNNEDLTISVKLTTNKKARTTLSTDSETNNSVVTEQKRFAINFIDGSEINGKKVLTTKFTDLTTVFESDAFNPETFGITNIDIDFNSSYVPMVKIDFIDVRGSSIFQNESNLLKDNTSNKYATFFEFPYPLFELEIKGYYGKPVTYCLHMLKFNSKFNSKTGNFEISCDFIGYTYALLSDMLIGMLRVIPYTKIGAEKFLNYNSGRLNPIVDLVELKGKIDNIANEIGKIAKTTEEAKIINTFEQATDLINDLEIEFNNIQFLSLSDSAITENPPYNFVIIENEEISVEKTNLLNEKKTTINDIVKNYNELNINGLYLEPAKIKVPTILTDITKDKLKPEVNLKFNNVPELKSSSDVESFKNDLNVFLNNSFKPKLSDNKTFKVIDLRNIYTIINEQKDLIKKSIEDTQKQLANRVKENVVESLGFKPTVRNMVEVFTALIEVFIETIYEVSTKAEGLQERKDLFRTVFDDNSSVRTDYNQGDFNYYPWPAYSERNDKEGYKDKYLGENLKIKNRISDVPELVFIDDLLNAFLKAKTREDELSALNAVNAVAYLPINVLDTKLFDSAGNPYSRKELLNPDQVYRLSLIRSMVFLGYTNNEKYLTNEEILKMAETEAITLISGLKNPVLRTNISNITKNNIINSFGNVNNNDTKIITKYSDGTYKYTYFYDLGIGDKFSGVKVLPINSDLDKTVLIPQNANDLKEFSDDGNLFLTNYSSGINTTNKTNKFDDGGIYVKIFTDTEFEDDILPLVDTSLTTENTIILESFKADELNAASAGFNSFGGSYGIQEFVNMDFGESYQGVSDLMYVFYELENNDSLGLTRKQTESEFKIKIDTSYDIKDSGLIYVDSVNTMKDNKHGLLGSNTILSKIDDDKLSYPYITYRVYNESIPNGSFSLFGSIWYYLQEDSKLIGLDDNPLSVSPENYVKGLLFLNSIPFNNTKEYSNPFYKNEIIRLFNVKGGLIHTPRLWAAYIGSILWWLDDNQPETNGNQIIGGGRGKKDPVIWKWSSNENMSNIPTSEGAYSERQLFPKILDTSNTTKLHDSIIAGLPEQVKNEFKKVFFDFINGTSDYIGFDTIKEKLEIKNGSLSDFISFISLFRTRGASNSILRKDTNGNYYYFKTDISSIFKNIEEYNIIAPVLTLNTFDYERYSLFLEIKDSSEVSQNLVKAFKEKVIIGNTGYSIWEKGSTNVSGPYSDEFRGLRKPISVSESNFDLYFDKFTEVINDSLSGTTIQNEEERQLNEIFGISNKNDIKLMLYRHCKNIYDKWLGGVTDVENVIFQCGDNTRFDSNRNTVDLSMGKRYQRTKPRLIDSFRFVTRSFKDIGDELYVDPTPIANQITNTPNVSSYSVISQLLNDNKFDFIALPTYINYKDGENVKSMFKPFEYSETIGSCGPTFVCVYIGQKSNSLDIKSGKYPNDGFDMRCGDPSIPNDFSEPLNEYEDPIAAFQVNYSQQNQNIFKDITLDQSEFTETEESLKIIQDISLKGSENNPSTGGQNMYNVYAVRSYSAEVEMLGNAMIQPMMYFQLNNIPMFHGAYMIIRTKHNIKPNHMTTWFTGTRIRAVETPIIDIADAYMNLIETLDLGTKTTTSASVSANTPKSSPPIIQTLINNGVSASNVNQGNIKLCEIKSIKGVSFELDPNKQMICEAVEPFTKMLTDWVNWMISEKFKPVKVVGNEKIYVYVTSIFRTEGSNSAHSFGIAVDFQMGNKNGVIIPNNAGSDSNGNKKRFSLPEYFNFEYNPALKWLYNNSYKYGFVQPYWANNGKGFGNDSEEHWHWEYHGKSAICMLRKQPIPGKGDNNPSDNPLSGISENEIFNFVKNPLEPDGNEAIYNDCTYKTTINVTDKYNNITGDLSTTSNKKNIIDNQIEVKNFLKAKGLTKSQVSGIMGNIHKETGGTFNPLSVNKKDVNGYPSVGLIQWNGKFTPRGGSKDSNVILSTIGKTVNEQLTYLTTKSNEYRTWLNLPNSKNTKTSAYDAAFEFARLVEICTGCDTEENYKTSKFKPFERSLFANDYFNKFNDPKDKLYW